MAKMTTQLAAAGAATAIPCDYQHYVNPVWVSLLNLLGMNTKYDRCLRVELLTRAGRCIHDFLSGYCVHNAGHHHGYIIRVGKDEMDKCGPAMLQSHVAEIAGEVACRLCALAGGYLRKVYFGSG